MTDSVQQYAAHLRSRAQRLGLQDADCSLPVSKFFQTGGFKIHFLDWGGDGPPIILLHGGGLNAHTWDMICIGLRGKYRCIAMDLRGHGESDWSPEGDYAVASHTVDGFALLDMLGLKRAAVVGMSLGGLIAIDMAVTRPELVVALCLVDSVPRMPPAAGSQAMLEFRSKKVFPDLDAAVRHALAFNPRRTAESLRVSLSRSLRQLPDGSLTWKHDVERMDAPRQLRLDALMTQLWSAAAAIQCPILLARGAESAAVPREAAAAFIAHVAHASLVEIPNAGHTVQGDNPRELLRALAGFLYTAYPTETARL